ncbi:MAG: flagellar cap protein FliD N-terminal domain-containing protein, partial [Candidatus Neomarinimicrobiota bacterium]
MVSITGISGGLDIEGLVSQYRSIEILPRGRLEDRKDSLESRKSALTDLDSNLSTLYTITDRFTDTLTDVFATKQGES